MVYFHVGDLVTLHNDAYGTAVEGILLSGTGFAFDEERTIYGGGGVWTIKLLNGSRYRNEGYLKFPTV